MIQRVWQKWDWKIGVAHKKSQIKSNQFCHQSYEDMDELSIFV